VPKKFIQMRAKDVPWRMSALSKERQRPSRQKTQGGSE
jgi:hypothetical protein